MANEKSKGFFAYPSEPVSHSEIIEDAIKQINGGQVVDAISWKSTSVSGKFIMVEICRQIDNCEMFLCDLTNLNHNVLFELGYAVAKNKRICAFLDPTIERSKTDFDKFNLTTIGFSPYTSTRDIVEAFYKEQPYSDLQNTVYAQALETISEKGKEKRNILYLKSEIESESSIRLSRRITRSSIKCIIDDPQEVRIHPLSWYVEQVFGAFCVVAHFLGKDHSGWKMHNAKASFISGLSFGLGRRVLMVAHAPYESPIDYRELMRIHKTASECEAIVEEWLPEREKEYAAYWATYEGYAEEVRAHSILATIDIGDYIAEQEHDSISEYFVETSIYREVLNRSNCLVIGRKGSGKSAILYKIQSEISKDSRTHVCLVKPIGYELEGLIQMMHQALPISEKGYLIESFWKFLVYTELANSVYKELSAKPSYYDFSEPETALLKLVDEHTVLVKPDFSIRLEYLVNSLRDVKSGNTAAEQRLRISELLHDEVIWKFREALGRLLQDRSKVFVLIDNLDKNWKQGSDIETLSHLLLGLLSVSQRMCEDFRKSDRWRKAVDFSIAVFLRSDIFSYIIRYARERDKIAYSRIVWDDPLVLLRIVEERFMYSAGLASPHEVWERFFCSRVGGIDVKDYIIENIIPRPRDIIYVVKAALANAVNHKHTRIEEIDLAGAQRKYSQYAIDSLLVENGISVEEFEKLIYEFVGISDVVNENTVRAAMGRCSIPIEKADEVLSMLCERTFFGKEVKPDEFRYDYSAEDMGKIEVMARKTAESREDRLRRFKINRAYHSYLEIGAQH